MPIYLVRWPDLTASLIRAANESDLIFTLEQIDDPSGCAWTEYEGPLCFDFQLAVQVEIEEPEPGDNTTNRPIDPAHVHIKGVEQLVAHPTVPVNIRATRETEYDMIRAVMQFAFPATAAVYCGPDYDLDRKTLEEAIRSDAIRIVQEIWQHEHEGDAVTPAEAREAVDSLEGFRSLMRDINAKDAAEAAAGLLANSYGLRPVDRDTGVLAALDVARRAWNNARDAAETRKALLLALLLLEEGPPAAQA